MAKKQELSKTDRNFASKDADAIRNAWSKWDLPAYSCPAKDRYDNTIYSDVQKAVILQLKPIFEKWEQYILDNAKTDGSKTAKLARFRNYLKELLELPDHKFSYRYPPFSLLNFKENIRSRVNSEYRRKKQEVASGVMSNTKDVGKVLVKKQSLKQGIDNAATLLKTLESIETVQDFINVALAIQLLTGRRISEIISNKTNFIKSDKSGFIQFQGITKGDEKKFHKYFDIPVLGNCEKAISAGHVKAKEWLTNNPTTVGNHAHTIKNSMSTLFLEILLDCYKVGFQINSKTNFLRKLYVAYCLKYLRPEYIDEAMYIAQILVEGVEKPDGKMIFSITTASYYRGIVLEE